MSACGTTTGYKRGCRCDDCGSAHYRYRKGYALRAQERKVNGRAVMLNLQTVPAQLVIDHLWTLIRSGWTVTQIAAETGTGRNHLWNIRAGKFARVQLATADRLLAVDPLRPVVVDHVVVDRLIDGADWRDLGATREERIAAAERAWAMWGPARRAAKAQGTSDQALPGESLTSLEDRLGLRAGRDFSRQVAS